MKPHRPPSLRGRQADAASLLEIRPLLGSEPRRRDLLIEHLHAIQDRFGWLKPSHLAALAELMGLAQAEVYEVASFYAHFHLEPPASEAGKPCAGIACRLAGGPAAGQPCIGRCDAAPAIWDKDEPAPALPSHEFATLEQARAGALTRSQALAMLEESGLKGLGGAGFPAFRKWRFLLDAPKPRLLVINADEGEPGAFKDRHCLEHSPGQVIEGALLAAWAIEAEAVYLYLRDEYSGLRQALAPWLAGLAQRFQTPIHLRRGAGAYVCGEETALLESLEGKRGLPRQKPPFPAQAGLFGRPTLIHNVETLYRVTQILKDGPSAFQKAGNPRFWSISGRVRHPGVYEAPSGSTAQALIRLAGGMAHGQRLAAFLPGGASGGLLPASLADAPLDFGTLEAHGAFVGSASLIVLSDQDDLAQAVRNLLAFFAHESCGQCTPCRAGTAHLVEMTQGQGWDKALIEDLAQAMREASICGLGQAAPNPLLALLRHFPKAVP
jgi:NADH:ubiquinone oxidoreductase subunit F (NADH-binding)/NADH:ubiquinone oxidoreductase subunit E